MNRLDSFDGPHFWGLIGYTPTNRPVGSEEVQFPFFLTINTLGKLVEGHKYTGVVDDKFGRAEVRDFCFENGRIDFTRRYFDEFKHAMKGDIDCHGELVFDTMSNGYLQQGLGIWTYGNENDGFSLEPFPNDNRVKSSTALHFYEQVRKANDKIIAEARRIETEKIRAKLSHYRNCNS